MQSVRDDITAELFDELRTEVRGLDYDTRMTELWRASFAENVLAAIHYLDRDAPESLVEAPAAALAYARAAAQRDIPLSGLVRAHRLGHGLFLDVAMQYVSVLAAGEQVSAIIELVNRCGRFIDLVADQLIDAYEHEHDRWLSRRRGLQQQWVAEVLAGTPVDIPRAERVLGYPLGGAHIAAVAWADSEVPTDEVVGLFDQVRCVLAAELGADSGSVTSSLMVPTDEREARFWFSTTRTPTLPPRGFAWRVKQRGSGLLWPAAGSGRGCVASGRLRIRPTE